MKGPDIKEGVGLKWCSDCEYHLRCEECAAKDALRILRESGKAHICKTAEDYIDRDALGWVKTLDRLPTACEEVLVWTERYGYEIVFYDPDTDTWMNEGTFVHILERPYWRHLPEPPKEAES